MSFDLLPSTKSILAPYLVPEITDVRMEAFASPTLMTISSASAEATALGFVNLGEAEVAITLTDMTKRVGSFRIQTHQPGNRVFVDNANCAGNLHANVRFLGRDSEIVISDTLGRYAAFHDIYCRGSNQLFFWGRGASVVGCSVEIEGSGLGVIIGDDALFSSGIWFRNHNMHAVVDLTTRKQIGEGGVTIVVERHVWLGQSVLLLKCPRVGRGSIIGATSLVNKPIPPFVSAAGTPARVLRDNISWGRDVNGITEAELQTLDL